MKTNKDSTEHMKELINQTHKKKESIIKTIEQHEKEIDSNKFDSEKYQKVLEDGLNSFADSIQTLAKICMVRTTTCFEKISSIESDIQDIDGRIKIVKNNSGFEYLDQFSKNQIQNNPNLSLKKVEIGPYIHSQNFHELPNPNSKINFNYLNNIGININDLNFSNIPLINSYSNSTNPPLQIWNNRKDFFIDV